METIALRFFNVYGTGQRTAGAYAAVVPKFIELATQGNAPIIHGDGHQTRDFIHVDDVVEAVLMLAREKWNPAYAPVYNLSTGIEVSLLQLVKNIQGVLREISPTTNRPAPVHTDGHVGDILRSVGSSARIQNDTAWKPRISGEWNTASNRGRSEPNVSVMELLWLTGRSMSDLCSCITP